MIKVQTIPTTISAPGHRCIVLLLIDELGAILLFIFIEFGEKPTRVLSFVDESPGLLLSF
jgi:hypothetical protein